MRTCLASGFVCWSDVHERESGGRGVKRGSNANALSHVCCRQVNVALTLLAMALGPDCDSDSLTGMRCERVRMGASPCAAHLPQQQQTLPVAQLEQQPVCGRVWPGMAGRFAALREIGYQSFCNLVCNLKFMKHIPLTQKMQANV